jgi:hypothetical protein
MPKPPPRPLSTRAHGGAKHRDGKIATLPWHVCAEPGNALRNCCRYR